MKSLKKIVLSLIVITCIFYFDIITANAEEKYTLNGGTVRIGWADIENYFGIRPHSIELKYHTDTDEFKMTFKEEDADSIIQEGQLTVWEFKNVEYKNANEDGLYYLYNVKAPDGYRYLQSESGGVFKSPSNGRGFTEVIFTQMDAQKSINATICYNDDNGRDRHRNMPAYFDIFETNTLNPINEHISLNGIDDNKHIDCETYYDVHVIRFINSNPDDPHYKEKINTNFTTTIADDKFNLEVLPNYDVKATWTFPAKKIDVPIHLVWDDDNNKYHTRPNNIDVDAKNQNDEVESSFEIPTDNDLYTTKLFENMKYSYGEEKVEYALDVKNEDKYNYDVVKNDDGSFTIIGTYHKDESDNEVLTPTKNSDNNKTKTKENNPETSDDVIKNILMLIGSVIVLGICYKSYIKNNKRVKSRL